MAERPAKARSKRVPPPPVRRETPIVERLSDDEPAPVKKRRRGGSTIDVSGVAFDGVAPDTARKLERRLIEAATAFESERFGDAIKLLSSIEKLSPRVAEVLELRGLSNYRLGKWRAALNDLTAFEEVTGSVEQHPVIADCHRALGQHRMVEETWLELGEASPGPELVEEGRIVFAGSLADQGRVSDGIRLLEKAPRAPRKPKPHHLRRWYALADLYERGGDLARARRLFNEVATLDLNFGDAAARARNLR